MGTQPPFPKGQSPPIFGPRLLWQMAAWIKTPTVVLQLVSVVLNAILNTNSFTLQVTVASRASDSGFFAWTDWRVTNWFCICIVFVFSAHVYCGQMAGCIKMALGTEVGIAPGHIVLDGDPAPLHKRGRAPNFRPTSIVANGCMDQDATWCRGRLRLTRHCGRWGPSSASPKGAEPPIFGQCPLWPNGWTDQDATWYGGKS